MRKSIFISLVFFAALSYSVYAAEGMWILPNLPDSVTERMEEDGLEIEINHIYNEKAPSLKDAAVYLTSGYTGTIISDKGLLVAPIEAIANRLPDSIDYIEGYKSPSVYKEVPLKNLGAWILQSAQDVTYKITRHITGAMSEAAVKHVVDSVSQVICRGEVLPQGYIAKIETTSAGNYYLYVYRCYNDVRLVYLPPSGIANDSLKKERHSADFVIVRIYSNRDNEPAYYDNTNKVYETIRASIAEDDYKEGDFVFSLGFPNKTDRNILSSALKENICKLETRNYVYQFFDSLGYADLKSKIKGNSKQIDVVKGSGIIEERVDKEHDFLLWAANNTDFQTCLKYGNIVPFIDTIYAAKLNVVREFECITEVLQKTAPLFISNVTLDINDDNAEELFTLVNTYFVEFDGVKEQEIFSNVLDFIERNLTPNLTERIFEYERTKYKGNRKKYVADIFSKSVITDEKRYVKYLDRPTEQQLKSDILVSLVLKLNEIQGLLYSAIKSYDSKAAPFIRLYREGLSIKNPSMEDMPDANYTLRMSSGFIKGYDPDDITHIKAISQYAILPDVQKQRVTFLTDCDMAIGRTGYGVYDYNGDLLGMVIGWNREAENNTFVYNPEYHRLIALDIKYVMFILDRYASLDYVVREIAK